MNTYLIFLFDRPKDKHAGMDLKKELRCNINDLCYVSFFLRCEHLKGVSSRYFMAFVKELMSPATETAEKLEFMLTEPVSLCLLCCPT